MSEVVLDAERQKKAKQYARIERKLFFVDLAMGGVYVIAWLIFGWSIAVKNALAAISTSDWFLVAGVSFVFAAGIYVIDLPLSYYSGFVLPHRFELSTQTIGGWISDEIKGVLHRRRLWLHRDRSDLCGAARRAGNVVAVGGGDPAAVHRGAGEPLADLDHADLLQGRAAGRRICGSLRPLDPPGRTSTNQSARRVQVRYEPPHQSGQRGVDGPGQHAPHCVGRYAARRIQRRRNRVGPRARIGPSCQQRYSHRHRRRNGFDRDRLVDRLGGDELGRGGVRLQQPCRSGESAVVRAGDGPLRT